MTVLYTLYIIFLRCVSCAERAMLKVMFVIHTRSDHGRHFFQPTEVQ